MPRVSNVLAESFGPKTRSRNRMPEILRSMFVEPGNINLTDRPRVQNADGSVSTVRSMGVNFGDSEVLIPTVHDDGHIMSNQEAIDHYLKSGKHFGKFRSVRDAEYYARLLHQRQAALYR